MPSVACDLSCNRYIKEQTNARRRQARGVFAVAKKPLAACFCIEMWRVVAIMLYLNPHCLSVQIEYVVRLEPSFPSSKRVWRFELITDASPEMAFEHRRVVK